MPSDVTGAFYYARRLPPSGAGAGANSPDHEGQRPNGKHIRKIVIVGGGTAGWMTAAALRVKTRSDLCHIVLVESEEIGTVGVGEATIPNIKEFNRLLELDENDFVRNTQGTFKLAIQYVDWTRIGHVYFNPVGGQFFRPHGAGADALPSVYQYLLKLAVSGQKVDMDEYALCTAAAQRNRFAKPDSKVRELSFDYGYQFDAVLYAKYLRAFAEKRGVERVEGKVVDVHLRGEDGFIDAVTLQSGQRIDGDLFVDCSGFRGLLIGQALKIPYEDWTHWLPCDRALAVPCKSVDPLVPYTRSTAREAGWQWRIPLQHRIGNGYVFSSKFTDEQRATEVLLSNLDGACLAEPRLLKFTTGRRKAGWVKNCVTAGLSSGFLEPLESTSIHLIQMSITNLLRLFPDRDFNPLLVEEYNNRMTGMFEFIRDFIILHYHVTEREDTEFWRYCKYMSIPDTLAFKIEMFRRNGHIFVKAGEGFGPRPWMTVMYSQGIVPESYPPYTDSFDDMSMRAELTKLRSGIQQAVEQMPSVAQFIARNCSATPLDA